MKLLSSSLPLVLVAVFSGCTQKANLEDHLSLANQYFEAGDYKSAEIEYKNVLQIDSEVGEALGHLGLIYHRQGRLGDAYPFLTRTREVAPENLDYRRALASLFLGLGDAESAWEEARNLLDDNPTDPAAPLTLQEAALRLSRIDDARASLETLRTTNETAAIVVALGLLDANEGKLDDAELLFKHALTLDSNSSDAHASLASVLWARDGAKAAETAFRSAFETAKNDPHKQLRYAGFKLKSGNSNAAVEVIDKILGHTPNFVPGLLLKAQIAANEQRLADAAELSAKILRLTPYSPEIIVFDAKLKVGQGETDEAIKQLEKLTEVYTELAPAYFHLAQAYSANDQPIKSAASLTKALTIDPDYAEALLMQAALNARQGNPYDAITSLNRLLENNPADIPAQSLLAQIYLSENKLSNALEIFQSLSDQMPDNPQPPQLAGDVYFRMSENEKGRAALEESLARNQRYLPALERITDLDISEKRFTDALDRIDAQMEEFPDSEFLFFLKGKVFLSSDQGQNGEEALKRAIELKPTFRPAFLLLANYYTSSNQPKLAIQRLVALLDISPDDIDAHMRLGELYERQSDFDKARQHYQSSIKINSELGPALNNLAYIQAEHFNEIDEAYDLAMRARDLMPNDPATADTLGWIYHKRGDHELALSLVKESMRKIENHPMILYHLGKIQHAREDSEAAKTALSRALELGLEGIYVDDAKRILAELE